jgi:uncharacterized ferritin-like protein (DUF455 family)
MVFRPKAKLDETRALSISYGKATHHDDLWTAIGSNCRDFKKKMALRAVGSGPEAHPAAR